MPKREPQGDPEEGARLRAAFAYKGMSKDERAELLGVSPRTVTRYESGRDYADISWARVIEATGVPACFAEPRFGDTSSPGERAEAIAALQQRSVARIEEELRKLRVQLGLLEARIDAADSLPASDRGESTRDRPR